MIKERHKMNIPYSNVIKFLMISTILGLLFLNPVRCLAQEDSDRIIEFKEGNISLKQVLLTIEQQSKFHFSYDPQSLSEQMKIELPAEKLSIKKILDHLKAKHNIQSVVQNNVIILTTRKRIKSTATLRGVIQDLETGELLAGAQIVLDDNSTGVTSNAYGFYSLSSPVGKKSTLRVLYLGYAEMKFQFSFAQDSIVNISLITEAVQLLSVVISDDESDTKKEIQQFVGSYKLTSSKIKDITTFAGEPDALKALQFLPGVQSVNEGTANISVRGGSSDQNLFLLDEAPVYNPSHALGFFSIFNTDALQSITLYKSDIPVAYGGRLSSVVSIQTKEGNRNKRTVTGSIGTIASRLSVEGPLSRKNDKTSCIISGRYSYAGSVVNGLYFVGQIFGDPTANVSSTDNKIGFYDLNAKINHRKNDKNHFYLSMYSGHDNFYFNHITNGYSLAWGNNTGTFRWNRVYNPKLFSNSTAVFSNYNYEYKLLNNTQYFLWSANLTEADLKQDFDYYPNTKQHMIFGAGIQAHWIVPGAVKPRSQNAVTRTYSLKKQQPVSSYIYIGNESSLNDKFLIKYGIRYSNLIIAGPGTRYFFNDSEDKPIDSVFYSKGEIEKVFHRIDPRISFIWKTQKGTLTTSYDRTTQYFHLLANSSVGLPTDIWMPSGGTLEPQTADIFAITYQQQLRESLEGSIGSFYKSLQNIVDFKDNANLFVNSYIESQLLQGRGNSYGAELFLQKTAGKFRGSASYTWSKTKYHIEGVNNDLEFSPRFDKRHNLSITSKLEPSRRWQFSMNFVYTTGSAVTLPSGNFTFDGAIFNSYAARNSFRLPNYHRMDLSFRYSPRKNENRKYKSYWSFDIYNLYARKNPFTVYSQTEDYGFDFAKVRAIYLYKFVPSISYNFNF
jgi:hypothetical protein